VKFSSGTLKRFLGNFREFHVERSNAGSSHYLAFFLAAALFFSCSTLSNNLTGASDIVFLLKY
jgi:hypothetical protein